MSSKQQHTLKNAINCSGVGLHSGAKVTMCLRPAPVDTGVVFHRTDIGAAAVLSGNPDAAPALDTDIPARWDTVSDTVMSTTIQNDAGVKVATVEHLMAALAGCGVDNVRVELDGPEVPVMDGSSAPFVFLIECAGLAEQQAPRRSIRVLRRVEIDDGDRRAALLPSNGFSVSLEIDFDSPAISRQSGFFDLHNGGFKRDICRARTFGFENDVNRLKDLGLGQGGSLDNVVVVGRDDEIMNDGGLRYGDEFVRHKVLDCVGDFYLAGGPLLAHFAGQRTGHTSNNELLVKLFSDPANWEYCYDQAQPTDGPINVWSQPLSAAQVSGSNPVIAQTA
ncbi:MAG: UDP-3-O-acyl-N-acetylglucosamine deacetylase [Rhodospirillaceae bacterium]|nr:UDP-3-O-acyl-N-acetylglucosamine deacetylase [Rhodospirillaceae bacterium]MBT5194905.1 UDP-3-O-acyl-N-acetylglucosamine deacetylase [Rhodospirillaceae bacterium]MBT5895554.1 UDP-3-O-acyl-N-acetylglucosamine deacetylase [Rhodospirillaceae bacterium]MBT6429479.1 UDP-3-O-acyl-N-acetylglucosamine deacetylase [Rhodospirillaceae bacterium]MBT7757233.1 UDP-3-O-acyl-N-acetylglucosamine deacetylase [Rhodospirillaceae bacterium]